MDNAHVLKEWLVADGKKLYVKSEKNSNGRFLGVVTAVTTKANHPLPGSGGFVLTASCFRVVYKVKDKDVRVTWLQRFKFVESFGETMSNETVRELMANRETASSKIKGTLNNELLFAASI